MKHTRIALYCLLACFFSSCIEQQVIYKPKMKGDIVYEDNNYTMRYFNLWIDIGNEFAFCLDVQPKDGNTLVIQSLEAKAWTTDRKKNRIERLYFKKLTGEQYRNSNFTGIQNTDKEFPKTALDSTDIFKVSDTLSNIGNTYRYELTFADKYYIRDKGILFDMVISFKDLSSGSIFATKYALVFKIDKNLVLNVINGK